MDINCHIVRFIKFYLLYLTWYNWDYEQLIFNQRFESDLGFDPFCFAIA